MNEIFAIEEALNLEDQNFLENLIFNGNICWKYNQNTVSNNLNSFKDYSWFSHEFYSQTYVSNICDSILPVFNKYNLPKIDFNKIIHGRINLMTQKARLRVRHNTPFHIDRSDEHWVMIYYVNNSEGKTNLDNSIKINPKKGKLIIFDGNINHCSYLPSKTDRCVINFNFLK
jgi:hypothetical protein